MPSEVTCDCWSRQGIKFVIHLIPEAPHWRASCHATQKLHCSTDVT